MEVSHDTFIPDPSITSKDVIMLQLAQLVVDGTILGGIYAIGAIGMVLIFKATDVVSIVQGEVMMMAAFFAFSFRVLLGWPYAVSVILALGLVTLLCLVIERAVLRPLIKAPVWTSIMATVALMIVLQALARVTWGPEPYYLPAMFSRTPLEAAGIRVTYEGLAILSTCAIYITLLFLFFRYTKIGKGMRAVQMDKEAASLMGISVKRMFSIVWAMNGILVGTIGILLGPLLGVSSTMGFIMLKGFVVAVIGGFTSFTGSIIAGVLLGVMETLAGVYISTAMKDIVSFVALIAILVIRPTGLFAESVTKRV